MIIADRLDDNVKYLKTVLVSDDITFLQTEINGTRCAVVFAKDLTDKNAIGELILRPLSVFDGKITADALKEAFLSPEQSVENDLSAIPDKIVTGETAFLCDGVNVAFTFALKKYEKRSITEPPTSTVIKGPREGFVESLPVNVSLIRRRLKSPDLVFENMQVGRYSQTTVSICYVRGVADKTLVKKLKRKISSVKIDAVLDSSYISKYLGEHKTSVFKQVGNTEKPDILVAKILEGRVAVLVDGSPIALTVPYLLIEDFQSPSDYYGSAYSATLARFLRFFAVFIALMLPSLYLSAELFHLQLIPLSFLLTIVNSIKGIPLSPSFEMFFSLMIFEILNEASVRMPKYVGMVVSIVGGLVLGETAVNAGIISAPTLMIIAMSGICLYTVPELEKTFSVIRLVFLIIGGSLGAYGLLCALAITLIYLVSFENYSTPLCAPFSPLVKTDLKDSVFKSFIDDGSSRPVSLGNGIKSKKLKKETKQCKKH